VHVEEHTITHARALAFSRCNLQGSANGSSNDRVPRVAMLLGGGGLLPFVWYGSQHAPLQPPTTPFMDDALTRWEAFLGVPHALSLLKSGDQATVRRRFLSYSACILSFMGAVHWGLAMATPGVRPGQYVASVLPALVGWGALNVDQASTTPHTMLSLGFLAVYFGDEWALTARRVPPWYTFLRTPLTVAVVLSTTLAAFLARPNKERLI
jgi:hypothetical protein